MTKTLRITHIDAGVDPQTLEDVAGDVFSDPISGRWPKVSFSDGITLSYTFITGTKVVFFTRDNRTVLTNVDYASLIHDFHKSDRPWNDSNWRKQRQRVSEWKPDLTEPEKILA